MPFKTVPELAYGAKSVKNAASLLSLGLSTDKSSHIDINSFFDLKGKKITMILYITTFHFIKINRFL